VKTEVLYIYMGCQLAVAVAITLLGYGIDGTNAARSMALGSFIILLSQAYFTFQAFRFRASRSPLVVLGAIYRGGAGKYMIVMVLCALTFRFVEPIKPLLIFVAMFVMVITQCAASMFLQYKYEETEPMAVSEKEID